MSIIGNSRTAAFLPTESADAPDFAQEIPTERHGVDWRDEDTPAEKKEYSWYSDDPENITGDRTAWLYWTSHQFVQPTKRWLRLYLYHMAIGGPRRIRVGVYNRDGSRPIEIAAAIQRPTVNIVPSNWQVLANLAALSTNQTDLAYDSVQSVLFGPAVSSTQGWTIIEDFSAPANHLLHRIYELSVEPVGNVNPTYVVGAFTVRDGTDENITIPRQGGRKNPAGAQRWPLDGHRRYGLYRYSYLVQTGPIINVTSSPEERLPWIRISDKNHALGERKEDREIISAPRELLGNYPAWTEVQLTLHNDIPDESRIVQLWLDAMCPGPYWGAVTFLWSTPTRHYGILPSNTVIIPPIRRNEPGSTGHQSSALLDRFEVPEWSGGGVTRSYRFMHGGGASLPIALFIDPRVGRRGRRNIGFPGS